MLDFILVEYVVGRIYTFLICCAIVTFVNKFEATLG